MSLDHSALDKLVQDWLAVDINPNSIQEIQDLNKTQNYEVLARKLGKRIAFGTAGLRSSMQSGFAYMNDVTILQAAQGLVSYLEEKSIKDDKDGNEKSIVIGYDHRFNSQRFAEITATVALIKGFRVYYLGSVTYLSAESNPPESRIPQPLSGSSETGDRSYVHTPLVPFAIDYFKAAAGVMVTASHNPANDNGYKVYYGNGCQIIPPVDNEIASAIDNNLHPWKPQVWDVLNNFNMGQTKGLLKAVKPEVTDAYICAIESKLLAIKDVDFEFVYTPIHGVGLDIFEKVLAKFNKHRGPIKMHVVKDQKVPDPGFPTVGFPNPEEKGALDLAIETANSLNVNLVVANDPDADRFSVAIRTQHQWRQLTGNEIGFLFAQYVLEQTPSSYLSKTYFVNSTVSSQILRSMAELEGFNFVDTLTGFKWIGNKAIDLKRAGFKVPFAYEEAIGYMFGLVNDKDGIAAAVMWLQLYQKWVGNDPNGGDIIVERLETGYKKYGYAKEHNGYYKLNDLSKTNEIFASIRQSYQGQMYPETLGLFRVVYWRDLTIGYESNTPDHRCVLPADKNSQMITAILKHPECQSNEAVRFTCRGSGTEPKLKVYIEGKAGSESVAQKLATMCWNTLRDEWFKPEVNELKEVANG